MSDFFPSWFLSLCLFLFVPFVSFCSSFFLPFFLLKSTKMRFCLILSAFILAPTQEVFVKNHNPQKSSHEESDLSRRTVAVETTLWAASSAEFLCCWIVTSQLACGPGWPQQWEHHPLSQISSQCIQNLLCLGYAQKPLLCDDFCASKSSLYLCFKLSMCSLVSSEGAVCGDAWGWQILLRAFMNTPSVYNQYILTGECTAGVT